MLPFYALEASLLWRKCCATGNFISSLEYELRFLFLIFWSLNFIHSKSIINLKLLDSQYQQYIDRVKKTDCQAELRRLLTPGPPVYLSDKHGLPIDESEGDTYVIKLWYASDGKERSAKLKDALEGKERDDLWAELNKFLVVDSNGEENDDNRGNKSDWNNCLVYRTIRYADV